MESSWEGSETGASHEMTIIITCILDYLLSEKQPDVRHSCLPKTKPLPSLKSLGPPPPKPPKPPVVNLQAFWSRAAAVSETHREGKQRHSQPAGVTAPMPASPCHLPLCISSQGMVPKCLSMGLDIHHCLLSH